MGSGFPTTARNVGVKINESWDEASAIEIHFLDRQGGRERWEIIGSHPKNASTSQEEMALPQVVRRENIRISDQ